jgi:hypothetical protein
MKRRSARHVDRHRSHVLQRSGTQVYFAYVPQQLSRAVLAPYSAQFKEIEGAARAMQPTSASFETPGLLGVDACSGGAGGYLAAANYLATHRLTARSLVRANALVLERQLSSFRSGPMWVGANDPAHAWFVAPPAACVEALVDDLIEFNRSHEDLAVLLRACVSMCQLLLVHPFEDGNGRTARALLLGMTLRELDCRNMLFYLLDQLWQYKGSALHAASTKLRVTGSWQDYVSLCTRILSEAVGNGGTK